MGLFSGIMNKIFGHAAASRPAAASPTTALPAASPAAPAEPIAVPQVTGPPAPAVAPPAASMSVVDVAAVLDDLADSHDEKLDWRRSIVDLMKLVGIDSSLTARKELAREFDYTGDTGDSAKMNVWLHREVIMRLAANGGKVPADLLD